MCTILILSWVKNITFFQTSTSSPLWPFNLGSMQQNLYRSDKICCDLYYVGSRNSYPAIANSCSVESIAAFLNARHEERTQVRDDTNTCFFTRRGNKKKKKLYEKGVRKSDVQEKNENAGGNIRFSVLQLRMLT